MINLMGCLHGKYYQISYAIGLMFILVLSASAIYAQVPKHYVIVEFLNVHIVNNHSPNDAEIEFFGAYRTGVTSIGLAVQTSCIFEMGTCSMGFKDVYLSPGSKLDNAGKNETYYFSTPDKSMKLFVQDGAAFNISSYAFNRNGTNYGIVEFPCDPQNNYCRGNGYAFWDLPSKSGDYQLRILVHGWDT